MKKHIPAYSKNNMRIFDTLNARLQIAIQNAEKANESAQKAGTDNPSTKVVDLVNYLLNLKKQPNSVNFLIAKQFASLILTRIVHHG